MSGSSLRRTSLVARCAVLALPFTCVRADAQLSGMAREPRRDELLSTASVVVQAVPALGRVWPGYWPSDRPFILADSGYAALLYTTGAAPAGFEPVPDEDAVPGPPGRTYLFTGKVPGLSASLGLMSLNYPVPGGEAVAVPLDGGSESTLRFLFHEGFHAYQHRAFSSPHVREIDADPREVLDSGNVALWEVERRILREALATEDEAALRPLLRSYLAVRGRRAARLSPEVARYEAELERIEGTAEWVGNLGSLVAVGGDGRDLVQTLRDDLTRSAEMPRFANGAQWIIRLRIYATGAALAALLERLSPAWRTDVAAGQTLVSLVAAVAGPDAWGDSALAEAALSRFGPTAPPSGPSSVTRTP